MTREDKSIRKITTQVSRRNRECWECREKIFKGEIYLLKAIRYDTTIMNMYYHLQCSHAYINYKT